MSFGTYLQHGTDYAEISRAVNVENTASSINFALHPPKRVFINEIFPIEVKVSTKGGNPLLNAKVSCNVTKDLDLSKMSSEVFTTLASSSFNIQKSSFLAPGTQLDESRTSAYSDTDGIAKLYMRIRKSPLDSDIRIICEADNEISPPSTMIRVQHFTRKITQDKNYNEDISVSFNKNEEGFKSKGKV